LPLLLENDLGTIQQCKRNNQYNHSVIIFEERKAQPASFYSHLLETVEILPFMFSIISQCFCGTHYKPKNGVPSHRSVTGAKVNSSSGKNILSSTELLKYELPLCTGGFYSNHLLRR